MVGPFYWMFITSLKIKQENLAYPPTWWPERLTWAYWKALNHLTIGHSELVEESRSDPLPGPFGQEIPRLRTQRVPGPRSE